MSWVRVVAAAVGLSGCTLLYASELEQTPVQSPSDAGQSVEAGAADADVTADAGGAVDAGFPGCAKLSPAPMLCEDFDDDTPLAARWTMLADENAGRFVAKDTAIAFSPPRSGRMRVVNVKDNCSYARIERMFSSAKARRIDLRTRLRASSPWPRDNSPLAVLFWRPDSEELCQALFYLDSRGSKVSVAGINVQGFQPGKAITNDDHPAPSLAPPTDAWMDVSIAVREVNGIPALSLAIDGVVGLDSVALPQCRLGGKVLLGVGFHCTEGTAEVRADDVVFDFD